MSEDMSTAGKWTLLQGKFQVHSKIQFQYVINQSGKLSVYIFFYVLEKLT